MTSNQLSAFPVAISYAFGIIVRVKHLGHRQNGVMGIWAREIYWYSNKPAHVHFSNATKIWVMLRDGITKP